MKLLYCQPGHYYYDKDSNDVVNSDKIVGIGIREECGGKEKRYTSLYWSIRVWSGDNGCYYDFFSSDDLNKVTTVYRKLIMALSNDSENIIISPMKIDYFDTITDFYTTNERLTFSNIVYVGEEEQ